MIFATNNTGKLEEIRKILNKHQIYSLKEKGININIVENQPTFLGNARKKAIEIYKVSGEETIADDSGLCINCLNKFPGVMTHRFLGKNISDKIKNEYLINEVNKYNDRTAQAICSLVYYNGKNIITGEGVLNGFIAKKCRGSNGFGFDEIFELPSGSTLAELTPEKKNKISHRYLAIKDLNRNMLKNL